jgi:hypothetical protein
MQHGAEVAQKCTQSESLRDRDGCPCRAGRRMRGGAGFGCKGRRRGVGCVDSGALNHPCNIPVAFRALPNKQQVARSNSAGKIADHDLMAAGGVNLGRVSTVMVASRLFDTCQHTRNRFGAERVFDGSSGLSGIRCPQFLWISLCKLAELLRYVSAEKEIVSVGDIFEHAQDGHSHK